MHWKPLTEKVMVAVLEFEEYALYINAEQYSDTFKRLRVIINKNKPPEKFITD